MKRFREDPAQLFMFLSVVMLVLIMVVLGGIVYSLWIQPGGNSEIVDGSSPVANQVVSAESGSSNVANFPTPVVQPTRQAAVSAATLPPPPPTATQVPLPTSTPTPKPPDVVMGMANREPDCSLFTQGVAYVLSEELGLDVEVVEFESAETLFTALADQEIDLTMCFIDPIDREQIAGENRDRVGYIRQIGAQYYADDDGKLQIWASGASKARLRDQLPCVLTTFENIDLADFESAENGESWAEENNDLIEGWMACES